MGKDVTTTSPRDPYFPFIILQDSTRHWTLHATASSDAEMAEIFKKITGHAGRIRYAFGE